MYIMVVCNEVGEGVRVKDRKREGVGGREVGKGERRRGEEGRKVREREGKERDHRNRIFSPQSNKYSLYPKDFSICDRI